MSYAKNEAERQQLWKARKVRSVHSDDLHRTISRKTGLFRGRRCRKSYVVSLKFSEKYQIAIANVFHAGDGNIHPIVLFNERDADQCERVEHVNKEILTVCAEVGGTITGEHGIGVEKMDYMPLIFSPADLQVMATVKSIFNPAGLCNPGKISRLLNPMQNSVYHTM